MKDLFPEGVFCTGSESHLLVCIKEGLELLGIPLTDNLENSDLNIVDISNLSYLQKSLIINLETRLKEYENIVDQTLFLSIADSSVNHYISNKNYWFLTPHILDNFQKQGTNIPWAFGFRQKLIDFYNEDQVKRERKIIRNFSNSFNQDVRNCLDFILLPKLEKRIEIDRRKQNYAEYLLNLLSSRFCLTYGGQYLSDYTKNDWILQYELKGREIPHKFTENVVICRWDSWRLWESWALGCIPIHLDFDKYKFRLPVMPTNWQHYIGLDLSNIERDVERMFSLSEDELNEISEKGRIWAWKHYSPVAVAERILSIGIDKVMSSLN